MGLRPGGDISRNVFTATNPPLYGNLPVAKRLISVIIFIGYVLG